MTTAIRLLILAALAAFTVCAATAASASAYQFEIEGAEVTEPTNIEGTSGLSLLKGTLAGVKVEVECPEDTFTGKIEGEGRGLATLLLLKCKEVKPANCAVSEKLEGKVKDKLIGSTTPEVEFEPTTTGGDLLEITITGSECMLAGIYGVTGTQTCELPKAEEEIVEHEIVCTALGSKLKLGGNAATFASTEKAKLTSGKKWYALAPPPAPRTEWVDFTGNQPVLVDHRKNTKHAEKEEAIAINQFGENREVEWESPRVGETTKNWPVVYVLGENVKLEGRFAIQAATREFLEKKAEGELEITGETAVGGTAFSFSKKFTLIEVLRQIELHKEYLTTGLLESSAGLVKKVVKSFATITWKWSVKEKGRENPLKQELGRSTHNFYTLFAKPLARTSLYLTLLDLETIGIQGQGEPLEEQKVIAGTWEGFAHKEKEGEAGACVTKECPTIHIRTYSPATGTITRTGTTVLWYYEDIPTGHTLEEYIILGLNESNCRFIQTTGALLENLSGECKSWQDAFDEALGTEGIKGTPLEVTVQFPPKSGQCEAAGACAMLVKNWEFIAKGSSGDRLFPYTSAEVEDQNGEVAQGVENPQSYFGNHQIVEVGNKLYDPSYGTTPIGNGKPEERANNLLEYQEMNIGSFCNRVPNCQSPGTGVLKLHAE